MVSHMRVKTPTAAAAFLVDHLERVYERVLDAENEILTGVRHRIEMEKARLQRLGEKVPMLFSLFKDRQEARLDRMLNHVSTAIGVRLERENRRLADLSRRMQPAMAHRLLCENHRIDLLAQRAKAADPALLLRRGYSMTTLGGKIVRDATALKAGDEIVTRLEKGSVSSIIK